MLIYKDLHPKSILQTTKATLETVNAECKGLDLNGKLFTRALENSHFPLTLIGASLKEILMQGSISRSTNFMDDHGTSLRASDMGLHSPLSDVPHRLHLVELQQIAESLSFLSQAPGPTPTITLEGLNTWCAQTFCRYNSSRYSYHKLILWYHRCTQLHLELSS